MKRHLNLPPGFLANMGKASIVAGVVLLMLAYLQKKAP